MKKKINYNSIKKTAFYNFISDGNKVMKINHFLRNVYHKVHYIVFKKFKRLIQNPIKNAP